MSFKVACVFASLLLARAPVPPEPAPDPLGKGYMGIRVASAGGLTIESVERRSPANRAGLRAQDVIVRVGTLEPHDFDQVRAQVCSFRPGAVVEIEVQRGNERKVFKVKLTMKPPDLDYLIPEEDLPQSGP